MFVFTDFVFEINTQQVAFKIQMKKVVQEELANGGGHKISSKAKKISNPILVRMYEGYK
jgi:hypothetical protein